MTRDELGYTTNFYTCGNCDHADEMLGGGVNTIYVTFCKKITVGNSRVSDDGYCKNHSSLKKESKK